MANTSNNPELRELLDLMDEIGKLAPTRRHRLAPHMVDRNQVLTLASARKVVEHLQRCEIIVPPVRETPVSALEQAMRERSARNREPVADRVPDAPALPPLKAFTDIPEGWYCTRKAQPTPDGQEYDFWRVTKGKEGTQWEACSFAKRAAGGPDDQRMRTFDLTNIQQRQALLAIRTLGVKESVDLFVATVRRCKRCSSFLSKKSSRDAQLGPECAKKENA